MRRLVKKFETMEEANAYVRSKIRSALLSVGVTDWKIVNEIIRDKKHGYMISQDLKFDEVGGVDEYGLYRVYKVR